MTMWLSGVIDTPGIVSINMFKRISAKKLLLMLSVNSLAFNIIRTKNKKK